MNWTNNQLAKKEVAPIKSIDEDFSSGEKLIQLLGNSCPFHLVGKYIADRACEPICMSVPKGSENSFQSNA